MRRSLVAMLLLVIGVATALPILQLSLTTIYLGHREIVRRGTEVATERAQRVAVQVGALVNERLQSLMIATAALTSEADPSRAAQSLLQNPELLQVAFYDAQGRLIPAAAARSFGIETPPVEQLPLASLAVEKTALLSVQYVAARKTTAVRIALALPAREQGPAFAAADLSLRDLDPVLSTGRIKGSRIWLVDRDGKLLVRNQDGDVEALASVEGGKELGAVAGWIDAQHPSDARLVESARGKFLVAAAEVPRFGWRLITEQSVEQAFPLLRGLLEGVATGLGLALAMVLALAAWFARGAVRMVKAFTDAALKIAGGGFGVQVDYKGDNELGRLAQVFNYMSQQLLAYDAETRGLYKNLEEGYLQTMLALSNVIDSKDSYTHGHSRRVAELASEIGREMKLPEHDLKLLLYGGLLHDLGKIGVVEPILLKKSQLTDDEMKEMKEHPQIGATIIAQVDFLKPIIPAVRNHHERWDGKGYPDGLAGEKIPLMARIVAAADTWDACTSHRTYQRAMTFERALEVMKNLSGRQLDPAVVEALERVMRRRRENGVKVSEGDEQAAPATPTAPAAAAGST